MNSLDNTEIDKVSEQRMAELIGCTKRALEGRRLSGSIPAGVWLKHQGRIIYSKKRYDEWLESLWIYPQELTSTTERSGFASPEKVLAGVKPLPTPRHKRASMLHPSYVIV